MCRKELFAKYRDEKCKLFQSLRTKKELHAKFRDENNS
jgi:hypothetical protein